MPKLTLAGHPLHVLLNDLPMGMLPFSLAMDVAHALTGKRSYADAAYYSLVGGYSSALAAAAAGVADYLEIREGTQVKKTANLHAGLNLGLLGLMTLNLASRRGGRPRSGPLPLLLSSLGAAGLVGSAWYGGHLVYEHGARVRGRGPLAGVPETKLPGDERLVGALERVGQAAPASGPGTRRGREA